MSSDVLKKRLLEMVRELAYETDPVQVLVGQGRVQVIIETLDERGDQWDC